MKKITYFKCENCGRTSEDKEEILKCEASHYGLTIDEKEEWDHLKEESRFAGTIVSTYLNNEHTKNAFDKAIEKCVQFEKLHNLSTNSNVGKSII